jgi:Zn-dependent M28 family amino/carboxypeptidase
LATIAILLLTSPCRAQAAPDPPNKPICIPCIRADMDFLASDELNGRGSGTRDEHLAALFAASLFESFGLEPGGDGGSFIEKAPLPNPLPDAILRRLQGFQATERTETWNVVGILRGSNAVLSKDALLVTAHIDHLGIGPAKDGDAIYNGADDDASGTAAVIELARAMAHGTRPKRTILFVLFDAEEIGGFGNQYFLAHPPVPLERIVANLEFEMIGRPDPAVPREDLWLTGFERSDLGPELVKHGAHLVADPHPREGFFQRSDNYNLARRGIVAQTVSSFGLHADYHQPSDEIDRIDFEHMNSAIASMVRPLDWLANTSWKPHWRPGGKP